MFWNRKTALQRGNEHLAAGRIEKAVACYLHHADTVPAESSDALARAAKCYLRLNALEQPAQHTPGAALVFEPRRQDAIDAYEKAIDSDPNHVEAILGLADLLPEKSERRFELLTRVSQLQPRAATFVAIGDYYRSILKAPAKAYEQYALACEKAPRDETGYRRIADVCRRLGRPEEADAWCDKWRAVNASRRRVGRKP